MAGNSRGDGKGVVDDHLVIPPVGKVAAPLEHHVVDDRLSRSGSDRTSPFKGAAVRSRSTVAKN